MAGIGHERTERCRSLIATRMATRSVTSSLSPRGEQRLRAGHPWIYRTDVVEVDAEGGDLVQVLGPRRRAIGHALFSDRSQIADPHADARRRAGGRLGWCASGSRRPSRSASRCSSTRRAYRLVHGEADLLPSLVVDRYGDYLVVQTLSQGMDRLLPTIVRDARRSCSQPAGILARNDPKVRALEGLPADGRRARTARA